MNITRTVQKIVDQLKKDGEFNGIDLMEIDMESEGRRVQDLVYEGYSDGQIDDILNNYACVSFDFNFDAGLDNEYFESDYYQFEQDFRDWVLTFFKGFEECVPDSLYLDYGDNEFMVPGFEFPVPEDEQ